MKTKNKVIALVFISFLIFGSVSIQAFVNYKTLNPLETVRTLISRTINQIKTIKRKRGNFNNKKMREFIKAEAIQRFDLLSITQSLMGKYYSRASDTQKTAFTKAFANRLLQIYGNSLKNFDKQKILFKRDFQFLSNGRALIRTLLKLEDGTRIPIEYYLRKVTNIGWLIYDINIEGMSIIATYRPNFKKQFSSKSINTVINELNRSNRYIDVTNDKASKAQ